MKNVKLFLTKTIIALMIFMILGFTTMKISFAEIEAGISSEDIPDLNNIGAVTLGSQQQEALYNHLGKPFRNTAGDTSTVSEDNTSSNRDSYTYSQVGNKTIDSLLAFLNNESFDINGGESTGNYALRLFSSFFCIKHGQAIGRYHGYLYTNHTGSLDVSNYIKLAVPNAPYSPYSPSFVNVTKVDYLENKSSTPPSDEVRKRIVNSNVKYFKAATNLYEINNDFTSTPYRTNIFAYAAAFSNKSNVLHNKGNNLAQLGIWAVVGNPAVGEPSTGVHTDDDVTDDSLDNSMINNTTLITDSELWNAGAALDEYEEILTSKVSGNDTTKHNVAVAGTDSRLLNRPTVTLNSVSSSDDFVDNGQGNKVGTVQDSTGTTISKVGNTYYYKIGPFNMSDYALAAAKDVRLNGSVVNCIEKYSGKDLTKYKSMLGGIVSGKVTFKNESNGVTATVDIGSNPNNSAQIVYTDMLGNSTISNLTLLDGNYTRTPRVTDPEPYVYPYPNSTFYIYISKDACGANAVKLSDITFEYRQTKSYGEGWVVTSRYTQTKWEIEPERTGCNAYYCESCYHDDLSRYESNWGDNTGTKQHVKYCGGSGYCGDCRGICRGHKGSSYSCNGHHSCGSYTSSCYTRTCGRSSHTHTSSCDSRTCGLSAHTHGSCNSGNKTCSRTEHSHSSSCYSRTCGRTAHSHTGSCYTWTCSRWHTVKEWYSASNHGCYTTKYKRDYCSHGYYDGKHYGYNHWGSAGNDYCSAKTYCDDHNHNNCYAGDWEKTGGPTVIKGQPFLAIHDAQVKVVKTSVKTDLDVRLTTDVSIKKYIYDVQHVESTTLTKSGYDSTLTTAEGQSRKNMTEAQKQSNPVYVEYGDIVTYRIDLINAQAQAVQVKIRDILPTSCQVISIKVGNTDIPYTSVKDSFFTTSWIKVAGNSTTTTEIKVLVNQWKENTAWKNTARIITRNEGFKGYPSKTVSSVDYMRTDISSRPGPVVNLAEINGKTTESADWFKLNNYSANIDKFISAYDEKITKDNNNPNNANKMQITNEVNASSLLINNNKKGTKDYYTRYSYNETDKKQHPLFVEKGESITYSIMVSNDSTTSGLKKATQVRPSVITDKLQNGLYVKNNAVAVLYDKNGKINTRYDNLGTIPVKISKTGSSGGYTTYKFEIDNSVILNPGEYILFTINVGIEESNMYLYSLENVADLGTLTNINHKQGTSPVGPYDRIVKGTGVDVNYGTETSSEYVKMKDLVISGRVWLDRDKDGLMDLEGDKTFENGSINTQAKPSSNISYSTNSYEKAMEGIVVKLYEDVGKDGNDSNDRVVRTTKTDSNGIYTFGKNENLQWYSGEYSITGSSGSLVTKESEQRIPKADNKDANKNYTSSSKYINYYVEFEYDGVLYKSTEIYAGSDNLSSTGAIASSNYYIDSNAKELNSDREEFNKKYEYISYDVAYATSAGNDKQADLGSSKTLEFDKEKHVSYLRLDPTRVMTARSFVDKAGQKTNYLWLYPFNSSRSYTTPETDYLKYINLGLEEREDIDISLTKDVYEVKTTINGEEVTYNYDQLEAEGPNALNGEIGSNNKQYLQDYIIKKPYGLTLYESDFKYRFDNYKNEDVRNHKTEGSELNIEITYKITVDSKAIANDYKTSNGSSTDVKVDTRVHEILDLYDENLKELSFNEDGSMKTDTSNQITIKEKDTKTIDGETIDTLKDKNIVIGEAWYYPNNDTSKEPQYLTLSNKSNYSGKANNFKTDGYNTLYISGMDNIYIEEGQKLDIYVKYVLDKQDTMESNGKTLQRVLEIIEKTNNGKKNKNTIEGISQINAYSTWYHDTKKPASIVECDSNVGNIGLKDESGAMVSVDDSSYYEDTVYKTGIQITVDESGPIRELTGKVWDDSRSTTPAEGDTQYIGNGLYNKNDQKLEDAKMNESVPINYKKNTTEEKDILVRNAKVEYTEIIAIVGEDGKVRYYEEQIDGTAWNAVQKARTNENGEYKLTGYIPGYYVVRFTYGDNADSEITNIENLSRAVQDMLVFNGQDYKSTTYTGEADTLKDYNEILKRMQAENESDARDDEIRRLETIAYSEVMVNRIAEILKGLANGTELTPNNTEKNTAEQLKELLENTYMYADTVKFYVKPEKLEKLTDEKHSQFKTIKEYAGLTKAQDQILYKEIEDIEYNDAILTDRNFEIKDIDFGIEYRPESQIGLHKRISKVTLTTSDNQAPLIELVFDSIGEGETRQNVLNKEKSKGTENVQFISNTYKNFDDYPITSEKEGLQGFVFINIDDEIIQGSTIEIEYEFIATNESEIDRISRNLEDLRYKENAVAAANKSLFYIDNPADETYRAARTAANILKSTYGTIYNLDGSVMYRTKTRTTYTTDGNSDTGYYGRFLGEHYYTGNIGKKDVISSLKFDKILDFVDTGLVFKSDENLQELEENTLWSTTSSKELNDRGYLKSEVFSTDNKLIDPIGTSYDTYKEETVTKEDGTKETVQQPLTSNLIVSVDDRIKDPDEYQNRDTDPTINIAISKFLKPEEEGTINLKVSKVIATETETEDLSYENIAEVIQFTTSTGRRTNYATTIGNVDLRPLPEGEKVPSGGSQEYHESTQETDTSAVEVITLKPPTGLGKVDRIIRDTVETASTGIGILVITVALVVGGIVLVKFVIKKIKKKPIK